MTLHFKTVSTISIMTLPYSAPTIELQGIRHWRRGLCSGGRKELPPATVSRVYGPKDDRLPDC
jgi:hypothetical protein